MIHHANLSKTRRATVLLLAICVAPGIATAQVRWSDSPLFALDMIPLMGGVHWADSDALALDVTLIARGSADSNAFGIDTPAPPGDQPGSGSSVPTIEIDLARLRVWDADQGRFVNPSGAITIDLSQPTYLLTHGWDDTITPGPMGGFCHPSDTRYGMSSIARAIHQQLPNANLLAWEWGNCLFGSNPNCLLDLDLDFWDLVGALASPPTYLIIRGSLALIDADISGHNAGVHGTALAKALKQAIPDEDEATFGASLHFIGHSHGGGLLARAAEQLHDSGMTVASLSMLDTPRWGRIDSMDYLESPGKIGHVAVYYGDSKLEIGAFGAAYYGDAENVTSIRLNTEFVEDYLHLGVRGDDLPANDCYGSWFADSIGRSITFHGYPQAATVLDPRAMPRGRFIEGQPAGAFFPAGACMGAPQMPACFDSYEAACIAAGGQYQDDGSTCPALRSAAANGLRLIWYDDMASAPDWLGTGAVVASGSDPADPANVGVRLVDVGETSFFRQFDWSDDAYAFEFDYLFDPYAAGESLTVYAGEQIIYYDAADISLARGGLRSSGPIAVREFAGTTTQLNFVLRGDGVVGGMCLIDNLRLFALPAGDVDLDGDVDADDALRLMAVLNGPGVTQPPPGGSQADFDAADFDEDGDVDMRDFELMQAAMP